MKIRTSEGSANGKIILMGEHSVVYGKPAIAVPFPSVNLKTYIKKTAFPIRISCDYYNGYIENAPENLKALKFLVYSIFKEFSLEPHGIDIIIKSSIPSERGMGSSAAVAVSLTKALYKFFNKKLDNNSLIEWTNLSEKIIHGNPSGIDAAIIARNESLYFIKNKPYIPFKLNIDGFLIVADTGIKGNTGEAVSQVNKFLLNNKEGMGIIDDLGILAKNSKEAVLHNKGQLLGFFMNEADKRLRKLGVSSYELDILIDEARYRGAIGAKLTGGGKGGCMIAFCKDKSQSVIISRNLLEKGASNTWIYDMGSDRYD